MLRYALAYMLRNVTNTLHGGYNFNIICYYEVKISISL